MKKLTKKYVTDLVIEEKTELSGMIVGNISVTNTTIFVISGMLVGNLLIEEKSRAIIYGTLNGDIENHGICEIYGIVRGNLSGINEQILIDSKAMVSIT